MQGKLNIFQRAVLIWNRMHPYNAVHIVRIPRPLDRSRLEGTINAYLESKGITGLRIDGDKKRYHYYGGPADVTIKIIDGGDGIHDAISTEVREQLNIPFDDKACMTPFRFFAVQQEGSFYLGLVYFHLVAGADSIIFIMKNIAGNYMDKNVVNTGMMARYPGTYRRLLPFSLKNIAGWLFTLPEQIACIRRSFRPKYSDLNDHGNGFSFFSVDAAQFRPLIETAREWGVTVNDMFLGLMLMALSPLAGKRTGARRRKNISVASIANIRKDLSVDNPETFGIFLGYFSVSHPVPDGVPLERLVRDVHVQTDRIKKYRLYLRAIVDQYFALAMLSFLSPERRLKYYPKYYPLWAGITNVHLKDLWDVSKDEEPIDYIRAVSTGPVSPLVFSFTTVNDILNVGVSYRTAVYTKAEVDIIIKDFSKYISCLSREST